MIKILLSLATTDEWEEICIVPVDEEVAMAIECTDYQSLLISLGMQPPSDMVSVCIIVRLQNTGLCKICTQTQWAELPKQSNSATKGLRVINSIVPCVLS